MSKDPALKSQAEVAMRTHAVERGSIIETPAKIVEPSTDTTFWKADSPEGQADKLRDPDAFKTEGGRAATGNEGAVQDAYGEYIDNRAKFESARVSGDLKGEGKSVVKAGSGEATGPLVMTDDGELKRSPAWKSRTPEAEELYRQSNVLKDYKDEVEAGIVDLGDSPETARRKIDDYNARAQTELDAVETRAREKGALRDNIRADIEDGYRRSADPEVARIADDVNAERERVRTSNEPALDKVDHLRHEPSADDAYSGGHKGGAQHGDVPATPVKTEVDGSIDGHRQRSDVDMTYDDGSSRTRVDHDAAVDRYGHRSDVDTHFDDGETRANSGHENAAAANQAELQYIKTAGDTVQGVQTAGDLAEASIKQMGNAIDEDRDLDAGDAARIAYEVTPGVKTTVQVAEGAYDIGNKRGVEEALKVERGEQSTAEGVVRALGGTAVDGGEAILNAIAQPAQERVKENLDAMEDTARNEGRRVTMGEGARFFFGSMAETVADISGVNKVGSAIADVITWDARGEQAGQKREVRSFVDRNVSKSTHNIEKLEKEIERLMYEGNTKDPDTKKHLDKLLNKHQEETERLLRLEQMAGRTLGTENTEERERLKEEISYVTNTDDLRSYADDIWRQRQGGSLVVPDEKKEDQPEKDETEEPETEEPGTEEPATDEFVDTNDEWTTEETQGPLPETVLSAEQPVVPEVPEQDGGEEFVDPGDGWIDTPSIEQPLPLPNDPGIVPPDMSGGVQPTDPFSAQFPTTDNNGAMYGGQNQPPQGYDGYGQDQTGYQPVEGGLPTVAQPQSGGAQNMVGFMMNMLGQVQNMQQQMQNEQMAQQNAQIESFIQTNSINQSNNMFPSQGGQSAGYQSNFPAEAFVYNPGLFHNTQPAQAHTPVLPPVQSNVTRPQPSSAQGNSNAITLLGNVAPRVESEPAYDSNDSSSDNGFTFNK
jgi:hypothetical protein